MSVAGGKDIFMCYRTGGSYAGEPLDPGDILSVAVVSGKNAACPSPSCSFSSPEYCYDRVRNIRDGLDGNLNQNAGGPFISLCQAPYSPPVENQGVVSYDSYDDSYWGRILG